MRTGAATSRVVSSSDRTTRPTSTAKISITSTRRTHIRTDYESVIMRFDLVKSFATNHGVLALIATQT